MTPDGKKLTVLVDPEDFFKFTGKLHYGQVSQIIRKFITVINEMKDSGNIDKFNAWAYGNKPLTLKQPKGD